ncbi:MULTISPECIES: hypothetical protein [Bacillaceae]|uniref:Uncharacterized protein n=1 Tax=Evansella alkalicola TaxID=745819 RepID=A0ABS6JPN7_9BACI|nr:MULTISPECIES: hypothetical protein [Bacillaceae]MBU9720061.1 hypothetical protein [Bacillus alkalicola]
MSFILFWLLFPFIAISAGIIVFYKSKKWWIAPIITISVYILIHILYIWASYGRFDIVEPLTTSINTYSLAFSLFSGALALGLKKRSK